MSIRRSFGALVALSVLTACSDTTTAPDTSDAAVPSFDVVGQGEGAIVDHYSDEGLILLTLDPSSGLYAVHYTNSDQLAAFLECSVPEFQGSLDALGVGAPSGRQHASGAGGVYVIVNDNFPADLCDTPLAQGTIRVSLSVNRPDGEASGPSVASFSSNGVITNSDGAPVRLHHSRKGVAGPPLGTVSLR